eukprot:2276834-Rhodomonas_salina.1
MLVGLLDPRVPVPYPPTCSGLWYYALTTRCSVLTERMMLPGGNPGVREGYEPAVSSARCAVPS